MPKNFKSQDPHIPYFITFTVIEWLNVFTKPEYLHILWDSLQFCRQKKGLRLHAFVFMTNHIHLIISTDNPAIKLWEIIRDFKKFTAQKIIQLMQKQENRKWILEVMRKNGALNKANVQYQFWIQDDWAEEIQSSEFFSQKLEYIHYNPVRAEIAEDSTSYFWSSARFYQQSLPGIDYFEI